MNGSELNRTDNHLHARVFRIGTVWYADVGDDEDPEPDNPVWYGIYPTQEAALAAACRHLAVLKGGLELALAGRSGSVSQWLEGG